ncbi:MAG: hypothetical protein WA741_15325 [Candidatus Sulfotelmatobacter sp.]
MRSFPPGPGFGTLAEDYLHALAPVLVNPYEFPIDLRRDVAQRHVSPRVDVECRRDQVEQRLLGRQFAVCEVSEAGKFLSAVMPLHSRPVVEALQRQVDVFVGLEFDYGESAVVGGG